jgi:hypothetical protein
LKKGIVISSAEGLAFAEFIKSRLTDFIIITVFETPFKYDISPLDSLIETAKSVDFAIFIFSPDDLVTVRGRNYQSARDNIIFEFGVYISLLGRMNVFAVMPRSNDFRIPSDLQGINFASYDPTQIESIDPVLKHIKKSISSFDKNEKQQIEKNKSETTGISSSEWHVFLSYSRKDKSFKDELNNHLSQLRRNKKIKTWNDYEIMPGQEWEKEICYNLQDANLILLLISSDFLASEYCNREMLLALDKHKKGTSIVVPIILRACDWLDTEFSILNALPEGGQPIKLWDDQDRALLNVVLGIKKLLTK